MSAGQPWPHSVRRRAWQPWGDAAGLHLAVAFPGLRFGVAFEARCLSAGLRVVPVANHCMRKKVHADKLLLGYGHLEPEEIEKGVRLLKSIIATAEDAAELI